MVCHDLSALFIPGHLPGSGKIGIPVKLAAISVLLIGFYFSPLPQPGEWRAILLGEAVPGYAEEPPLWAYFTGPPGRTAAFFLFLWAAAAFLVRQMVRKRKVMLPLLLTITYLSILDSFTLFDGKGAVIRSILYGLFCLAWFRLNRLQRDARIPSAVRGWYAATWALIALAVGIGWLAPKADASWPDPVSWITSLDERAGNKTKYRFVGYSTDDRRLGGPFIQDQPDRLPRDGGPALLLAGGSPGHLYGSWLGKKHGCATAARTGSFISRPRRGGLRWRPFIPQYEG